MQVPERSRRLGAIGGADNVSGRVQVSLACDVDELGAGRDRDLSDSGNRVKRLRIETFGDH